MRKRIGGFEKVPDRITGKDNNNHGEVSDLFEVTLLKNDRIGA